MTIYGRIKQGRGTVIGNAGEYLVVGELLRRDIVAAPAPRNTPGFDVLATTGEKSVNVRVKSKTAAANSWVWISGRGSERIIFKGLLSEGDFTVLADLKDTTVSPDYWVYPTKTLDDELQTDFKHWVESPGRGGRQHSADSRMYRFGHLPHHQPLQEIHHNAWNLIVEFLTS